MFVHWHKAFELDLFADMKTLKPLPLSGEQQKTAGKESGENWELEPLAAMREVRATPYSDDEAAQRLRP